MKKIIFGILIALFVLYPILCEEQPIVSVPQPVKNYVDFYNKSDYAIFNLELLNPTNYTIKYVIYTLSPDWIIIYGKGNLEKQGVLYPESRKIITIYARPSVKTTRAASFLISFYNKINTSVQIYLSPFIVYKLPKEFKQPSLVEVTIHPEKEIKEGEDLVVFISMYNPNDFEVSVPIYINLSYGVHKEIVANISPGNNVIQESFIVPTSLNISKFNITILVGGKKFKYTLNVIKEKIVPKIEKNDGYIVIINPSKTHVLFYDFEMPYSKWDLLMYRLYPPPKEYIIKNGKIYARWDIVLMPQESFIIKKKIDIYFVLVILVILGLIIAFIIDLLIPRVEIKKEIVRLSLGEGILRVAIYIRNKSILPLKYVTIRDRIPVGLKVKRYDVSKPSGLYKENKETILEWSYDEIRPKEEIIISYTIEIPKEIKQKRILLPPASITYNYLYMSERLEASNTISITLIT